MLGTTSLDIGDDKSQDMGVVEGRIKEEPIDVPLQSLPAPPEEDLAAADKLWHCNSHQLVDNDYGLLFREQQEASIDGVVQQFRQPVVYVPYSALSKPEGDQPTPGQTQPRITRSLEWKQAIQSVEWQCRWLELRMLELGHTIAMLKGANSIEDLTTTAAARAEGADNQSSCIAQAHGVLQQQQLQLIHKPAVLGSAFYQWHASGSNPSTGSLQPPQATAPSTSTVPANTSAAPQQPSQQQPQQKAKPSLQGTNEDTDVEDEGDHALQQESRHEQLAAHGDKAQQQGKQQQGEGPMAQRVAADTAALPSAVAAAPANSHEQQSSSVPATATAAPADSSVAESGFNPAEYVCEPARVFAGLELVEKHLADIKHRLAQAYDIDVTAAPSTVRLGVYASARCGQKRPARGSMTTGPPKSLQRNDSLPSFKRRRFTGVEDDVVISPTASGAIRLLERTVCACAQHHR